MRIEVERSGGFAGIKQTRSISTDDLSGEDAKTLTGLVESVGLYSMPAEVRATQSGADRFQYRITVESEKGSRTVLVDEAVMPMNLKALLDWVNRHAK